MVYVTAYGQVYHEKADCSHLNRQIRTVKADQVGGLMNRYGIFYEACGLCIENDADSFLIRTDVSYITAEGEKYHVKISCPALKRTVESLPKQAAVKKYRPCSSCTAE